MHFLLIFVYRSNLEEKDKYEQYGVKLIGAKMESICQKYKFAVDVVT